MAKQWDEKEYHQDQYRKGQEGVGKELEAGRLKEQFAVTQEVLNLATETVDLAHKLAADGNHHKKQLAELISGTITRAATRFANGQYESAEERPALEATPFSSSLPLTETTSPDSFPKALPQTQPKARNPKGRPRKS